MAEPGEVRIKYTVDTAEINTKIPRATAQLEEMESAAAGAGDAAAGAAADVGEMGDAAAAATPQIKGATAATAQAGDAAKKTGDAAKKTGASMATLGDSGKKLKGALSAIVPGAEGLVGVFDDMADAQEGAAMLTEGLGKSAALGTAALGALAVSVAAVTAAINADAEAANRINELRAVEKRLATDLRGAEDALAGARLAGAVATGRMSEAAAEELQIRRSAQAQIRDYLTGLNDERRAVEEQIASSQKWATAQKAVAAGLVLIYNLQGGIVATAARAAASGKSLIAVALEDVDALNQRIDAYTGVNQEIEVNRQKVAALTTQSRDYVATVKETTKEQLAAAAATRSRAAAEQETAEWLARTNALFEQQVAANRAAVSQFEAARATLAAAEQGALDAIEARATGELGALERTRAARYDALKATYEQEYNLLSGSLSAQETLRADYLRALAATEADYQQQRNAILEQNALDAEMRQMEAAAHAESVRKAEIQRERDAAAETLAIRRDVADQSLTLASGYVTLAGDGLATLAEKAGWAEAEVFKIRKAAALANGAILTAQGILTALQTPPPLTAFAVGLAAATGALQIAQIAASQPPSFRAGGLIGSDTGTTGGGLPDARLISAEMGEGILTRQGVATAGGEDGVDAMNAGQAPGDVVVGLRLGHRTMEEVIVRTATRPGPVRSLMSGGGGYSGMFNPYPRRGSR